MERALSPIPTELVFVNEQEPGDTLLNVVSAIVMGGFLIVAGFYLIGVFA